MPTGFNQKEMERINFERAERARAFERGSERGKGLVPEGSLGRLDKKESPDIQTVLEQRRKNVKGFTPEEMARQRSTAQKSIAQQQQAGLRQLRGAQGASGVRGGVAGAQQARLIGQGVGQQADAENKLQLANIAQSREGLSALEGTARESQKVGQERDIFNIKQLGKEKNIELQSGLSEQLISSAALGNVFAQRIAEKQGQAAGGGGKK
jgi:hypothetical protein